MGVFYECINVDKEELLNPIDCGNGLKMTEHGFYGSRTMNAVETLLGPEGSWHKARIKWQRDCMVYYPKINDVNVEKDESLRYLVNHDQKVYIDLGKLPVGSEWTEEETGITHQEVIHPLPILTASSTMLGRMGDYKVDSSYIGNWAENRISMERKVPKLLKEIQPNFKEIE